MTPAIGEGPDVVVASYLINHSCLSVDELPGRVSAPKMQHLVRTALLTTVSMNAILLALLCLPRSKVVFNNLHNVHIYIQLLFLAPIDLPTGLSVGK